MSLFGFAERNDALLTTIEAEGGIGLINQYKEKSDYRDELQTKLIKRRIPSLRYFFNLFNELLSEDEKQNFDRVLDLVAVQKYLEIDKKSLDQIFNTLKRFSDALIKEQQRSFELLKKSL